MKIIDPFDFGVRGDGITDDRAALQAALNSAVAGDVVRLTKGNVRADGPYLLGNFDGGSCLNIPAGVAFSGTGGEQARLIAAPGIPGGVRIIDINAPDVTISDLILDGNAANQPTPTEHMHGLMTRGARTILSGVVATGCCGDGFYAYNGAFGLAILDCLTTLNGRHGITLSGTWDHGIIKNSRMVDNKVNQIHTEAGLINYLVMLGNKASKHDATDHMVTIGGIGPNQRSMHWDILENQFDGGILVGWADDIKIYDNKSNNTSVRPCVTVQRTSKNIRIYRNDFTMEQTTDQATGVIAVTGTAEGGPERVIIEDNHLTALGHPHSFGVRVEGAVSVQVMNNRIDGPGINVAPTATDHGSQGSAGVYARATSPDRKFASMLILNNHIRDFGQFGVAIMGNGAAEMTRLDIIGNVFDDGAAGTMITAISLDPCVKDLTVGDNVLVGSCVREAAAADLGWGILNNEVPPRTFPPHRWIRG